MNKENAIKKINTIGKAGSIISNICFIIMCIGIVAAILGGILLLTLPKDLFSVTINSDAVMSIDASNGKAEWLSEFTDIYADSFGTGTMEINGEVYTPDNVDNSGDRITAHFVGEEGGFNQRRLALICWVCVVYMGISTFLLLLVKRLCDGLKTCKSPFEERIIKDVERCTWTLIPWGIMSGIASSVTSTAFTGTIEFGPSFSLSTVIVILLLFGLGFIFKYGAYLQTESDETL